MTMGCFLGTLTHQKPTFALSDENTKTMLISELRDAIDVAQRVGSRYLTMLLGRRLPHVPLPDQIAAASSNLLFLAEIANRAGVKLLVEAISTRRWPDVLISNPVQACNLCKTVRSDAVKILFDVNQCGQESRNILADLETCWDEIGCIQIADSPGRCEPGTGIIDFPSIFAYLSKRNWSGLVEMEHAVSNPGIAGELAIIRQYETLNQQLTQDAV
jgi:hydroxypyruvate isomerase